MVARFKQSLRVFLRDFFPYAILGLAIVALSLVVAVVIGVVTLLTSGGSWAEAQRVAWDIVLMGFTLALTAMLALYAWGNI